MTNNPSYVEKYKRLTVVPLSPKASEMRIRYSSITGTPQKHICCNKQKSEFTFLGDSMEQRGRWVIIS